MDIQQRLAERAQCVATHDISERVPHNGFGWTGTRCPKCGFMFFGEWDDWVKREHERTMTAQPGNQNDNLS